MSICYRTPKTCQVASQFPYRPTKRIAFIPAFDGARHIFRAVVDKQNPLRRPAQNIERGLVDRRVRFAQSQITGTERDLEVVEQAEGLKAIIVGFARLVVERAEHAVVGCGKILQSSESAVGKHFDCAIMKAKKSSREKLRGSVKTVASR